MEYTMGGIIFWSGMALLAIQDTWFTSGINTPEAKWIIRKLFSEHGIGAEEGGISQVMPNESSLLYCRLPVSGVQVHYTVTLPRAGWKLLPITGIVVFFKIILIRPSSFGSFGPFVDMAEFSWNGSYLPNYNHFDFSFELFGDSYSLDLLVQSHRWLTWPSRMRLSSSEDAQDLFFHFTFMGREWLTFGQHHKSSLWHWNHLLTTYDVQDAGLA